MGKTAQIVEINPDRITCRTVNPFGNQDEFGRWTGWFPNSGHHGTYEEYRERAERHRGLSTVFPLLPSGCKSCQDLNCAHCQFPDECMEHYPFEPGTKHAAEIIDGKAKITTNG